MYIEFCTRKKTTISKAMQHCFIVSKNIWFLHIFSILQVTNVWQICLVSFSSQIHPLKILVSKISMKAFNSAKDRWLIRRASAGNSGDKSSGVDAMGKKLMGLNIYIYTNLMFHNLFFAGTSEGLPCTWPTIAGAKVKRVFSWTDSFKRKVDHLSCMKRKDLKRLYKRKRKTSKTKSQGVRLE